MDISKPSVQSGSYSAGSTISVGTFMIWVWAKHWTEWENPFGDFMRQITEGRQFGCETERIAIYSCASQWPFIGYNHMGRAWQRTWCPSLSLARLLHRSIPACVALTAPIATKSLVTLFCSVAELPIHWFMSNNKSIISLSMGSLFITICLLTRQ